MQAQLACSPMKSRAIVWHILCLVFTKKFLTGSIEVLKSSSIQGLEAKTTAVQAMSVNAKGD